MSDYIFLEYPKWVTIGEADPQLFETAEDEKAAKGEPAALIIDARWGAKRLAAELDKAK